MAASVPCRAPPRACGGGGAGGPPTPTRWCPAACS
jgi:hypothetical protein